MISLRSLLQMQLLLLLVPSAWSQSDGACCSDMFDNECSVESEEGCNSVNGTFYGNGTTCANIICFTPTSSPTEARGACCNDNSDNECEDGTTDVGCEATGGFYQGDGTTCEDVICFTPSPTASPTTSPTSAPTETPTGACCNENSDNECEDGTTDIGCLRTGGIYQGDGTTCEAVTCVFPTASPTPSPTTSPTPAPTRTPTATPTSAPTRTPTASPTRAPTPSPTIPRGACCNEGSDNQCEDDATAAGCSAAGGFYRGDGTTCANVVCFSPTASPTGSPTSFPTETPTGACCNIASEADGQCEDNVTELGCVRNGGFFEGDGTTCENVVCFTPSASPTSAPTSFPTKTPTGACCNEIHDNQCEDNETELGCVRNGGVYQGDGTACGEEGVVCFAPTAAPTATPSAPPTAIPIGACCNENSDNECEDGTTKAGCETAGGFFEGDGTICANITCFVPSASPTSFPSSTPTETPAPSMMPSSSSSPTAMPTSSSDTLKAFSLVLSAIGMVGFVLV